MASPAFNNFDLEDFWDDSDYAVKTYVEPAPTDDLILSIEEELGYKLPAAYIALMKTHNGGVPVNTRFPTDEATSWADDHVAISGIAGIGRTKLYSLCGEMGSQFMIEEWGYPEIGVCVCDCPSAGHDMIMLDYSACGHSGEPTVIHVDQEDEYRITALAPDFESFIRGLMSDEAYDTSEQKKEDDLVKVTQGTFSSVLTALIEKSDGLNYEKALRTIGRQIVEAKGHFSLHADALSTLVYDIQFLLYRGSYPTISRAQYLKNYPTIIVFGDGQFRTGGYAEGFVTDWLASRMTAGQISQLPSKALTLSPAFLTDLKQKIQQYE